MLGIGISSRRLRRRRRGAYALRDLPQTVTAGQTAGACRKELFQVGRARKPWARWRSKHHV
jgi:hypothetical protein